MTRQEMNRNIANNIEEERIRLGLSQQQMAAKLELSLSSYKRIVSSDNDKLDFYVIYKMYELTGKLGYELAEYNDDFLELKSKIRDLSETQIKYITGLVDFEREFKQAIYDTPDNVEDYVSVFIPTGDMYDGMIYDTAGVEHVNIARYRKRFGNRISCGIKITSNHLHPLYNLGDILLISKEPIRDGDVGVFVNSDSNRVFIRKFHQTSPCWLEPINEFGDDIYVDSNNKEEMKNWIKFGVILTKIR